MLSWSEAHRLGVMVAGRALKGVDLSTDGPVDLMAIADKQGIVVNFMPIPSLAGAYVAETTVAPPGIMINTRLPQSKQRYTLGHELGHHFFEHGSKADSDVDLMAGSGEGGAVPDEEKVAEAFAAWVLMPRKRVHAAIASLGSDSAFTPETVYRLSLLLGASYTATATHLTNLKQISWSRANDLRKVKPKEIKSRLLGELSVNPGPCDVHLIDPTRLPRLDVRAGDILVVPAGLGIESATEHLAVPDCTAEGGMSHLVVEPNGPVNPIRPTTSTHLDTSEGRVEVCIHHSLQGVSERWFE